jgi:DNA-binding MurR/RpiR family transcriptional regulator
MLCDFPGDLASYSTVELAKLANVSTPTVSRFIRRLGYASYEEARVQARLERESGSRLYLGSRTRTGATPSLVDRFDHYRANLDGTGQWLDPAVLDAVTTALLSARRVSTIGLRAGQAFAVYMHWQLLQVIEPVFLLPAAGQTLGEHLINFTQDDIAVVFGLRRRVVAMDAILSAIRKRGSRILYITDEGVPFHKDATWHIRCSTTSPGPLFSHVGVLAVCHAVAEGVIEKAGPEAGARLRAFEAINESLDDA